MNRLLTATLVLIPALLVFWVYAVLNPQSNEKELPLQEAVLEISEQTLPDHEETTPQDTTEVTVEPLGEYSVAEVVDGDTVVVGDGTEFLTVRILGIDAPETVHSPDGPECFNTEATLEADRLLAGKTITLHSDPTQDLFDSYNRLLAYITLNDGSDFGKTMIKGGYAREYTFKGRTYQKQQMYRTAEKTAQSEKIGVWDCE